jgi:hypothetical protein
MSRKSTLSNSTAMGIFSDAEIREQARLAFSENATSEALAGSAVQRLAFAIRAELNTMAETDKGKKLGSIVSVLTSAESSKAIGDAMVEYFIPALPEQGEGKSDKGETAKASRVAQVQLLRRALVLGAILARAKVSLSEFIKSAGHFSVPSKLLLGDGETAFGRLAAKQSIPLDGKPILFAPKGKDESVVTARASVARLVKLHAPGKPRPTKKRGGSEGTSALDNLASIAATLTNKKSEIHFVNLSDDMKSHLGAIAHWYATELASEKSASASDVAKAAAKRAAEAEAEKPKPATAGNVQALRA